jgi:hypothetical protein
LDPPTERERFFFASSPFPFFISRIDWLATPSSPPSPRLLPRRLVSSASRGSLRPPGAPNRVFATFATMVTHVWIREFTILRFAIATRKDNASSSKYVSAAVLPKVLRLRRARHRLGSKDDRYSGLRIVEQRDINVGYEVRTNAERADSGSVCARKAVRYCDLLERSYLSLSLSLLFSFF